MEFHRQVFEFGEAHQPLAVAIHGHPTRPLNGGVFIQMQSPFTRWPAGQLRVKPFVSTFVYEY